MPTATCLLDLLVPLRCVVCGARGTVPWCATCAADAAALRIDRDSACPLCAGPVGPHACWRGTPPVRSTVASYRYAGPVAEAIVAGKTRGVRGAWDVLGERLAEDLAASATHPDVVTWVPAPARRRRRRGYDHAELLARVVAQRRGSPAATLLTAPRDLADRGSRHAAARPGLAPGTYRPARPLSGVHVLLVDDVLTTGATATVASGALVAAGATSVDLAVVARAGTHPLGQSRPSRWARAGGTS